MSAYQTFIGAGKAVKAQGRAVRQVIRNVAGRALDVDHDRVLAPKLEALLASDAFAAVPRQRILVAGVQTARRPGSIDRIFASMASERHDLTLAVKDVGGMGKLDNINALVAQHDIAAYDWLWMIDDDIELPARFTDIFVALCMIRAYHFAQPAHRTYSYKSHAVTKRQRGLLAHESNYVEIGPFTAFHCSVFDAVLPFPSLRWGWGPDILWSHLMDARGWRLGIVDAAALRHTSPVAATYDWQAARDDCHAYLAANGVNPEGALVQRQLGAMAEVPR